jgi:triphosphoribosyl-dephospho-CoA synthase
MQSDASSSKPIPIGAAATLACLYEVTARKPGNVYPGADFDETTTYAAFVKSAVVIGPIIERTPCYGVGQTVLDAVQATRDAVGTNTNLGTLLLIAPLAAVPRESKLADGIGAVLDALSPDDTRFVYEAIRLANAGGLGREDVADIRHTPPPDLTLKEAMSLAAERDLVAKQYTNSFDDVFDIAAEIQLGAAAEFGGTLESSIIGAFLSQLQRTPDTLIQRKLGQFTAQEASFRAEGVVLAGTSDKYPQALADFDRWLRADGHRRNPGTTADLIAAALFVLLRDDRLNWKAW